MPPPPLPCCVILGGCFEPTVSYNAYKNGDKFITPNVSYIEESNKTGYIIENKINCDFESSDGLDPLGCKYFYLEKPAASDLTITVSYNRVIQGKPQNYTHTYHINKGEIRSYDQLEMGSTEYDEVIISPKSDNSYVYVYNSL